MDGWGMVRWRGEADDWGGGGLCNVSRAGG